MTGAVSLSKCRSGTGAVRVGEVTARSRADAGESQDGSSGGVGGGVCMWC